MDYYVIVNRAVVKSTIESSAMKIEINDDLFSRSEDEFYRL
jgi:hypothetical protein